MDEWERLEREATAGPWEVREHDGLSAVAHPTGWAMEDDDTRAADLRLSAFLRNRSPELRAVVEAAKRYVDRAEALELRLVRREEVNAAYSEMVSALNALAPIIAASGTGQRSVVDIARGVRDVCCEGHERGMYEPSDPCDYPQPAPQPAPQPHRTYVSVDASSYDERCDDCGATDAHGDKRLRQPCPGPRLAAASGPTGLPVIATCGDCRWMEQGRDRERCEHFDAPPLATPVGRGPTGSCPTVNAYNAPPPWCPLRSTEPR